MEFDEKLLMQFAGISVTERYKLALLVRNMKECNLDELMDEFYKDSDIPRMTKTSFLKRADILVRRSRPDLKFVRDYSALGRCCWRID